MSVTPPPCSDLAHITVNVPAVNFKRGNESLRLLFSLTTCRYIMLQHFKATIHSEVQNTYFFLFIVGLFIDLLILV